MNRLGAGFVASAGGILTLGLTACAFARGIGLDGAAQAAIAIGVLTAAAGCASWVVLFRMGSGAATRGFLMALLGGVILRMGLYAAVVASSVLVGGVHLPALIVSLMLSHLAYQTAEIVAVHRQASPGVARAAGIVALVVACGGLAVPARALAVEGSHGDAPSRLLDIGAAGHTGEGRQEVPAGHAAGVGGQAAETAEPGVEHGEAAEEGEFDLIHHVSDGRELETPFGTVELPAGWMVGGIDMAPTKHVVWMWIAAFLLTVFVFVARRSTGRVSSGLGNALEALVVFIRDEVAAKNIPDRALKFTPYLCSLFFFILACNLSGLLPFGSTATGNLNLTGALAILSLFLIQAAGIRQNGLGGHLKGLCPIPHGVPGWLLPIYIPIIVVVEIVGIFVKPIALALRLFANMIAGHVVILSLIGIIFILQTALVAPASVGLALFIYCLEVFIGFVQAYIFTLLTALFIGLSQHPAH
ncbi:MAG: F0F1 ATP synthase subunit A [Acidobacteriota bacterium]